MPAPIPFNRLALGFGNSRTEQGLAGSYSAGLGYGTARATHGYQSWLQALSNGRLRFGRHSNFGISAANLVETADNPRRSASGNPAVPGAVTTGQFYRGSAPASGSDNKGWYQAASHEAGLVILWDGVNDTGISGAITGSATTPGSSRFNMLRIMNDMQARCDALGIPRKVFIVLSEIPTGIASPGYSTAKGAASADMKAYSDWLLGLDFESPDPHSRTDTIAVDLWTHFAAGVSAPSLYENKPSLLYDGLHEAPPGARLIAERIIARLDAVWPNWRTEWPRMLTYAPAGQSGLVDYTLVAPFLNSNPNMVAGTNGQAGAGWGVAPSLAGIPQGWRIDGTGTISGLTVVADKATGLTDPLTGNNLWQIDFTTAAGGFAANANANITLTNALSGANFTARYGAGGLAKKLRARARFAIDAAPKCLQGVEVSFSYTDSGGATRAQNVRVWDSSSVLPNVNDALGNQYSDAHYDGYSTWFDVETDLADLSDADLAALSANAATPSSLSGLITVRLRNRSASVASEVDVGMRVAMLGIYDASAEQLPLMGLMFPTAEGNDALTSDADLEISGTTARTEGNDTATIAGESVSGLSGQTTATEAGDAIAAASTLLNRGTAAISEGADLVTIAGTVVGSQTGNNANAAIGEGPDVVQAGGVMPIGAALIQLEAGDTVTTVGALLTVGVVTIAEAPDTTLTSASLPIGGLAPGVEQPDGLIAVGLLPVGGVVTFTEQSDAAVLRAEIPAHGQVAVTEAGDALAAGSTLLNSAAVLIAEQGDSLAFETESEARAAVAATEAPDGLAAGGGLIISTVNLVAEASDMLSMQASLSPVDGFHATAALVEADDGMLALMLSAVASRFARLPRDGRTGVSVFSDRF